MIGRTLTVLASSLALIGTALAQHDTSGDHGLAGWLVRTLGIVVVLVVLIYTIKLLVRPGERNLDHIKRRILDDDSPGGDDER